MLKILMLKQRGTILPGLTVIPFAYARYKCTAYKKLASSMVNMFFQEWNRMTGLETISSKNPSPTCSMLVKTKINIVCSKHDVSSLRLIA